MLGGEKMNSAIANNVRKIIASKGIKQIAVANKAGYSIKTFNNMLNGRKIISDVDVINIANALQVTPNELFGCTHEESRSERNAPSINPQVS